MGNSASLQELSCCEERREPRNTGTPRINLAKYATFKKPPSPAPNCPLAFETLSNASVPSMQVGDVAQLPDDSWSGEADRAWDRVTRASSTKSCASSGSQRLFHKPEGDNAALSFERVTSSGATVRRAPSATSKAYTHEDCVDRLHTLQKEPATPKMQKNDIKTLISDAVNTIRGKNEMPCYHRIPPKNDAASGKRAKLWHKMLDALATGN